MKHLSFILSVAYISILFFYVLLRVVVWIYPSLFIFQQLKDIWIASSVEKTVSKVAESTYI